MINLKLTGIVALVAALLSFIIGLFSEVTAGALFLRALASGVFFALLITGLGFVIKKFLPELLDDSVSVDSGDDIEDGSRENNSGGRLNIVLEGDEEAESHAAGSEPYGDSFGKDEDYADDRESVSGSRNGDSEDMEELESVENFGAAKESAAGINSFRSVPLAGREEEDIEEAEAVDDSDESVQDIGAFENQFSPDRGQIDNLSNIQSGSRTIDIMGTEHDPEDAAKAIKTILKKEQEG